MAGPSFIVGVFRDPRDAQAARAALLHRGLPEEALALARVTGDDGVADEFPGESYENQPGQSEHGNAAARYGEAIRSGVCTLSVEPREGFDPESIAALLEAHRAMRTLRPPT
jgi:hypothetical protein